MKLALILPLLFGGLTGVLSYDRYLDKAEQSIVTNSIQDSNNVITAYIDGENKVYLNDINDSSIVEDNWKNTETKRLSLNLDFSNFDSKTRYLEIDLPLGMELKMTPDSIVDNRNILSVDKTEFRLNSFSRYNNSDYIANQGKLIYEISESVNNLNLDLLISIDNKLWDTQDKYACSEDVKAITVTIGDANQSLSKKVDRIMITKDVSNAFYGTDHNYISGTIIQNQEVYFNRWFYTNQNKSLIKETVIEMELPYVEKNIDGNIQKQYLEIRNLKLEPSGSYEIIDNILICKWNNVDSSLKRIIFNAYADKRFFEHDESVYLSFKNMRFKGVFSNKSHKLFEDTTLEVSKILSNEYETLNIDGSGKTAYIGKEAVNIVGSTNFYNKGVDSSNKSITFNFPKKTVGIKGLYIPVSYYSEGYDIEAVLWNSDTGNEITLNFYESKKINNDNSILLTVDNILKKSNLNINDTSNLYIKSINYDMGVLRSRYNAVNNWIYGKSLIENDLLNHNYQMEYTLTDLDSVNLEKKVIKMNVLLSNNGHISTSINSKIKDVLGNDIKEIQAGEQFIIEGELSGVSYPYKNTSTMVNPRIYLKLPKGFKINESAIKIIHKNKNNIQTDLSFEILNKDIPREFNDGDLGYVIDIKNEDKLIGYFDNKLESNGTLLFEVPITISKSVKTARLNFNNFLFIGDKNISSGDVRDIFDLNENGSTSDYISGFGNTPISIVSSTNWLDVDNSVENESGLEDKYKQEITDNSKVLRYGLNISNNNEGVVKVSNSEYYIPIPKKGLDYNSYVKPDNVDFNFDMELASIPVNIEKHKVMYSYNNIDYFDYTDNIDITRVSMVKIINTEEILHGDNYNFYVDIKYKDDSWNKNSNSNSWSAYGIQTYTKNGSDSTYVHVFDPLKVELKFEPKIIKNPKDSIVNIGENVTFLAEFDLGAPVANTKWQYKKPNTSQWIDLLETDEALVLQNVNIGMDGYEYRYVASNDVSTIESQPAILRVIDVSSPTIELIEIKEGDNYKIQINVTDVDNGVSHIILPDGTTIYSNTHIIDAIPNTTYIFKAYDLAGNEAIAEITILTGLTPKVVSSNLDVYIKSENILQMSLDTNSISFDDFSGIEDVEKINAVNLTINSSLPYQINAYLPTEIQNTDKTKTLDKSILNIKENSESAYQTFNNTTDKIVLKDNCSAGNQLTHGVDLKLSGGIAHEKDVYKAVIKLEVEQK